MKDVLSTSSYERGNFCAISWQMSIDSFQNYVVVVNSYFECMLVDYMVFSVLIIIADAP
jgi:hypothetical protein